MVTPDKPARLFVIAAPSGAGKTTLVKELVRRNPELVFSISYTTRARRPNEVEGSDYFFVNEARFRELEEQGELLESARVFGNLYGTSRSQVESRLGEGRSVVLEIDWQGARQVRRRRPDCVSIFILPPSGTELDRRLRGRGTDDEATIERRLADALSDMSHWDEFDYCVVNDRLENAVARLEAIAEGGGAGSRCRDPALRRRIEAIVDDL
ncbi:MAG TPA: guanylate kinase [Woeseiaceae bacterium]|nr:guanylate kinase [Woeseiaceae bacterium]